MPKSKPNIRTKIIILNYHAEVSLNHSIKNPPKYEKNVKYFLKKTSNQQLRKIIENYSKLFTLPYPLTCVN